MNTSAEKLGRIGIITETDGSVYSARVYLIELIRESIGKDWDLDLLILGDKNDLAEKLRTERTKVFQPFNCEPFQITSPSGLIHSGLSLWEDIARATPLYQHLVNHNYDSFIFIGLSPAICSLLPITRKRNCVVPLLAPGDRHYFLNNQALRTALLNCDYFLCHSAKEAAILRDLQPHAEVKNFPLMVDPEMVGRTSKVRRITFDEPFVLMIGENESPTLLQFSTEFKNSGYRVVLGLDRSSANHVDEMPVVDTATIICNFEEWLPMMKGAGMFLGRQLFPVIYNFCQYNIPLYLAPNYPWHHLFDGQPFSFLSFDSKPDLSAPGKSSQAIPYGYQHYKYYINYWIRFLLEWCVNNKLRCDKGAWQFPKPAPAKRTAATETSEVISW